MQDLLDCSVNNSWAFNRVNVGLRNDVSWISLRSPAFDERDLHRKRREAYSHTSLEYMQKIHRVNLLPLIIGHYVVMLDFLPALKIGTTSTEMQTSRRITLFVDILNKKVPYYRFSTMFNNIPTQWILWNWFI